MSDRLLACTGAGQEDIGARSLITYYGQYLRLVRTRVDWLRTCDRPLHCIIVQGGPITRDYHFERRTCTHKPKEKECLPVE